MSDQVTILRSPSGVLTKRIAFMGAGWCVTDFSAGARYAVHERTVDGIGDLAGLLGRASAASSCAFDKSSTFMGVSSL